MAEISYVPACIAWRNWVDEDPVSGAYTGALTPAAGSVTFTVDTPSPLFFKGARASITHSVDDEVIALLEGAITAWNPTTRSVTVNVDTYAGTAQTTWVIELVKFSLGSWQTTLPLSNIEDERLYKPARSTDAAVTSTRLRVDMGNLQTSNAVGMIQHTADKDANWRIRWFEVNATTGVLTCVHDSAKGFVWPVLVPFGIYPWGTFPWDHRLLLGDNYQPPGIYLCREQTTTTSATSQAVTTGEKTFAVASVEDMAIGVPLAIYRDADNEVGLLGKITDITGLNVRVQVTDVEGSGSGFTDWIIRFSKPGGDLQAIRGRLLQIDLFNPTNADGFLDIGRVIVAPAWFFSAGIQEGGSIQFQDDSPKRRSRGGQPFADPVASYRKTEFTISFVERDEMMANMYEIQKVLGVRKPFLVILDPNDETNLHRLTIYGSLERTSPIKFDPGLLYSCTVNAEEWVA